MILSFSIMSLDKPVHKKKTRKSAETPTMIERRRDRSGKYFPQKIRDMNSKVEERNENRRQAPK